MSARNFPRNVSEQRKIKLVSPDDYYSIQFIIEAGAETIVGRSDEQVAFYPVVDLSTLGAYGLGVSRTHAILELIDGELYITDMSSNGTMLDGTRLPKGERYQVANHSLVTFGELTFHVVIQSLHTAPLLES